MKHNFKHLLVFTILLPMLILSSCVIKLGPLTDTPEPSLMPTDWHSGVKTDYSGLTSYKPPEETYTRLKDGAMPNLEPSDQYGTLLPYIGERMYSDDGYNTIQKYGLTTRSGILVTDPVFSRVYQGSCYNYSTFSGDNVPAYTLVTLSDQFDEDAPWDSELFAVCAVDGSWVTPFVYTSVVYTEKVILLLRDNEKNDVDIIDYSGKLLYNTKSLDCYADIPAASSYEFMGVYGEGFLTIGLSDNRSVFVDVLTGNESYVPYKPCFPFSDGLAAAAQNGLYGYIDKDHSMVIPPQYTWADYFYNGKSIVQFPDSSYAIIDTAGNILLKDQYYINKWDTSIYGVYDVNNNVVLYNSNLQKLAAESQQINTLYNGWFYYIEGDGITVFKGNERYTFQDITGVNRISGNLVSVYKNDGNSWQEGLITLDGNTILPMTDNQSISLVTSENTGDIFAIVGTYDSSQTFMVYDAAGKLLFSGNGYANFNAQHDLFEVISDLSYAYIDTTGKDIFRISLLQYLPD